MGLFSGSFGTGLITGLASGVDKSLRAAMDKRDKELSAARTFWQQRQAQKMDLAEARDKRTNKALDRMIDEMGGDVAKGVAAFKAAGGDVDQVESFIAALDETRNVGLEYNVQDKLKLDGVDLSQYGDLTREKAYKGFATEVKGVDIQMQDMSGLDKLGLGMKDMGKGISESINKLIPAREREAIGGITGGVLDRTGLITSERYKQDVISKMPDIEKQIKNNVLIMTTGKDVLNNDVDDATKIRLKAQNAQMLTVLNRIALSKDTSATSSGLSAANISASYSKRLSKLNKTLQFTETAGQVSIQPPDQDVIMGSGATAYYMKELATMESDFIKDTILNDDGTPKSKEATDMAYSLGLGKVYESTQKELISAASSETKPSAEDTLPPAGSKSAADKPKPKTTADKVKADPNKYVVDVLAANPSTPPESIRAALLAAGVPTNQIDTIINNATALLGG